MARFQNIPNLDLNLEENGLTDAEFLQTGSSGSSSHSYNRLSITERNPYELNSSRNVGATGQHQRTSPETHEQHDLFECNPQSITDGPHYGQLDGGFNDDCDPIEKDLSSGGDSDEDRINSKGTLLSRRRKIP